MDEEAVYFCARYGVTAKMKEQFDEGEKIRRELRNDFEALMVKLFLQTSTECDTERDAGNLFQYFTQGKAHFFFVEDKLVLALSCYRRALSAQLGMNGRV